MDIALYISELLNDHDEVGLQGVGSFYRKRVSARFNSETGIYYPPVSEIAFKTAVSNDTLLADYISHAYKISKASARYFINKYTEIILRKLDTDGKAEMTALGVLQKTATGGIFMQPHIATAANFGLTPVKDPAFAARLQADEAAETASTPLTDEPGGQKGSFWQALGVVMLLVLLAGGLTYVFYPEFFNLTPDKPVHKRSSPAPVPARTAPAITTDTISKDSDSTRVAVSSADSTAPAANASAGQTASGAQNDIKPANYEIIGASFALRSEAETYVKLMQSRGIRAGIMEDTRKPKFKVSLGSFSTYEEANQEKRRIQSTFNKEAWIFTVKDKAKQ